VTTPDIIRTKVQQLAKELGRNASGVRDDDILPETGVLDSAAIIELIVWVETEFGIDIDQGELSLENFGSIRRMTAYIDSRRA
jgi:D-alanine--poly(phosphoribitol) ligase subunit 2